MKTQSLLIANPPYASDSPAMPTDLKCCIERAFAHGLKRTCCQQSTERDDWDLHALSNYTGDDLQLLLSLEDSVVSKNSQVLLHHQALAAFVLLDQGKLTVFAGSEEVARTLLAEMVTRFGQTAG